MKTMLLFSILMLGCAAPSEGIQGSQEKSYPPLPKEPTLPLPAKDKEGWNVCSKFEEKVLLNGVHLFIPVECTEVPWREENDPFKDQT